MRFELGYQNTRGNVFSKVLPFERNGGLYLLPTQRDPALRL